MHKGPEYPVRRDGFEAANDECLSAADLDLFHSMQTVQDHWIQLKECPHITTDQLVFQVPGSRWSKTSSSRRKLCGALMNFAEIAKTESLCKCKAFRLATVTKMCMQALPEA